MPPHAQKTRKNLALKVAIVSAEITQREVARRTGIGEVRLSQIVIGSRDATEDEQKAIAKVLHRQRTDLFPDAVAL